MCEMVNPPDHNLTLAEPIELQNSTYSSSSSPRTVAVAQDNIHYGGTETTTAYPSGVNTPAVPAHDLTDAEMDELVRTLSKRTSHSDQQHLLSPDGFDLEKYLRDVLARSSKQGILHRSAGLLFKDLTVRGKGAGATFQPTLSNWNLGGMFGKTPMKTILHGLNGVVDEGEMLLVLGRPGAGCTSLLKSLAGETSGFESVDGAVTYHGLDQATMKSRFRGEVVYNAEVDTHFPTMTVDQTLRFAAEARAPRSRLEDRSRKEYIAIVRDVLATVFGLRHTYNTKVGNDFVRGVSGGERKRVSIAEMMATRARLGMWDNSTRGLDASTALEFARALRVATNLAKNVAVVAIYQAGEQIYQVFDKVTILYDGRQIFFGPIEGAKEFFERMGFECPPRQATADFLTAVTDPAGRFPKAGWESRVPRTADEFEKYWRASPEYQSMLVEMGAHEGRHDGQRTLEMFDASTAQEKAKHQRRKSPYTVNYRMQLTACIKRSYQRTWGDKPFLFSKVFAAIFQSLIIGSVFYDTAQDTSGFFSLGGVLFFAILYNALQAMSEIASMYEQRPIILKHKSYALYHPSADAFASLLSDIPIQLAVLTAFDIILYFMTGLQRKAGQFWIFYLFTFITTLCMTAFFRALAALTRTVNDAMMLGGIGVLAIAIYTGYVIPRPTMRGYFRWISYINPVAYGFESLMVNEFHGRNVQCAAASLVPFGAAYAAVPNGQVCAVTGATAGSTIVSGDSYLDASFGYSFSHLWRNFGIIIGFWLFFLAVNLLATEFMSNAPAGGEVLVFRKGKAPKHITEALSAGKAVDDLEAQDSGVIASEQGALADTTPSKEMEGVALSKDTFSWQHVNYDIMIKGNPRKLLSDVQGFVKPGTLTALMGESGAGKTTLLNVLAQRVTTGVITGDMLVNGSPLDASFQRKTGYVQQQDVHLAQTTVREALRFSAMLRQPKSVSKKEKHEYVETVIKLLEMEDYAEAVVGVPGEGLNVEQRKRLTVGVELAAKPALLLFLDEPTSGLDSQSAWSIVVFLRKLANAGQAILCTIHQPSAVLFEQFDRLLLLQKGGKTVYFGDIGRDSRTMIDYFERNGGHKCGRTDNPAEYILDVIGAGATASASQDWHQIWLSSPENQAVTQELNEMHTRLRAEHAHDRDNQDSASLSSYAMPFSTQFWEVMKRTFSLYWRSPEYIISKVALNIIAGLFIGFTFYKLDVSLAALQNRLFAIFMAVVLSTSLINQIQPRFIDMRTLYEVRERPSKMYNWVAFTFAAIIVEIPYNMLAGTLFYACWYLPIGFFRNGTGGADRNAYMWLMLMVFEMFFTSFGQAIAAASPNAQTAAIIQTLFFSFVLIFNGVLQPLSQLVGFWHWMYHLSPFTYLIEGMLSNVLHELPVRCQGAEINIFQPAAGQTCNQYAGAYLAVAPGYLYNPDATADCQYCTFKTGDGFLATRDMSWDNRWRDFGILIGYVAFNMIMTFVLLWAFRLHNWNRGAGKQAKAVSAAKAGAAAVGNQVVLNQGDGQNPGHEVINSGARQEQSAAVGAQPSGMGPLQETTVTSQNSNIGLQGRHVV
ncbi:Multidrug resistance protein [Saitoella coloradoensis]